MQIPSMLVRSGLVTVSLCVTLPLVSGLANAADPLPPPGREDRPSTTDCGFISPQQAFVGFYGPARSSLPDDTIGANGGESRGEKVEGTVALEIVNGGCGLSAKVGMQRNTCDEHQSLWDKVRGCGWKDWGEREFIYDDIPTNGVVVFPAVRSAALKGTHTYRMVVEVTGNRLQTADPKGRFRGALLPGRDSHSYNGPEVRLTN